MKTSKDQQGRQHLSPANLRCQVCAHLSPNIQYSILMSFCHMTIPSNPAPHANVDITGSEYRLFLSESAPLAPFRAHPSSADQASFACSLPPHAFLLTLHYVFTAQNQVASLLRRRVPIRKPYWRPSVLPHQEDLLCCSHKRYPSQLSPRAKLCFTARSKPRPRHPDTHLSAVKLAHFLSRLSNIHSMRYPPHNKYRTIFSRARRKLEERCIFLREMSGGRGGERGRRAAEVERCSRAARGAS